MTTWWNSALSGSARAALLAAFLALAACGGGGGGDDGGGGGGGGGGGTADDDTGDDDDSSFVTTEQGQSAAKSTFTGSVDSNLSAASSVAASSAGLRTFLQSLGLGGLTEDDGDADDGGGDDGDSEADVSQQLGTSLDTIFASESVRDGDTITYDPDEEAFCADALLAPLAGTSDTLDEEEEEQTLEDCIDFYSHVTVVQTIVSEDEGTLEFRYDDHVLATLGYAPDTAYTEVDLAEWKSFLEAIAAEESQDVDLPETFEGVVRFTAASLGPMSGRVTLSIEEDINIADGTGDEEVSIHLGAAPRVYELTADGAGNTASFELGLAAIEAMFPVEDTSGIQRPAVLSLDGLTLLAEIENDGEQLVFSNVSLGDEPYFIDVTDDGAGDDPRDLEVSLPSFGFVADGAAETLVFDPALNLSIAVDDRFGIFGDAYSPGEAHTLELEISQGAEIAVLEDPSTETPVFRVDEGSVAAMGTGDYAGDAEALPPQCYVLDLGALLTQPSFPLEVLPCP